VLEQAEQHVEELKELLKTPTPENFETANLKLASVLTALQSFASESSAMEKPSTRDTAFLSRLSSEMAQVLRLFKGPVDYLQGLTLFRAQRFGSYNRVGELKGLGHEGSSRTITHL
jgi:hypothetical protein